jgi:hypothetical protein
MFTECIAEPLIWPYNIRMKFLLLAVLFISPIVRADTMSGGGYMLNGGVDVFTGESTGGGYTLNPQGDPIAGNGASGGGYSIQPTPYVSPSSASEGQVLAAVTSSGNGPRYGDSVRVGDATTSTQVTIVSTTTTITTTDNPNNPGSEAGAYNTGNESSNGGSLNVDEYGNVIPRKTIDEKETDHFFGHSGSTTLERIGDVSRTPAAKTFFWILVIALLIILWKMRKNHEQNTL